MYNGTAITNTNITIDTTTTSTPKTIGEITITYPTSCSPYIYGYYRPYPDVCPGCGRCRQCGRCGGGWYPYNYQPIWC